MIINAHTTIGQVLKHNPESLNAIISLSTRFRKLRNPVLRKLMAARTSIATAAKIGGCSIDDFFTSLKPLGFEPEQVEIDLSGEKKLPSFLQNLDTTAIEDLDVRPIIESGKDPLQMILKATNHLQEGKVLRIINTFEPVPLMKLLENKGFSSFAEVIDDDLVETYFYKNTATESTVTGGTTAQDSAIPDKGWDEIEEDFKGRLIYINVQQLEMPQPMIRILESLDTLPNDHALYVYHKRVPVFLLPELKKRSLDFRVKEINENEVHLLIYSGNYGSAG